VTPPPPLFPLAHTLRKCVLLQEVAPHPSCKRAWQFEAYTREHLIQKRTTWQYGHLCFTMHVPHLQPQAPPTNNATNEPATRCNRGRWTDEEDRMLRYAVDLHEGKNWKSIAAHLEARTDVQCLHRWQKVLRPGLKKGPWAEEVRALVCAGRALYVHARACGCGGDALKSTTSHLPQLHLCLSFP